MHPALLVDEILRLVFEVVWNYDKSSLCCAARCCRAWKDPALDLIWGRLPSAIPLLSLLPGFWMQDNVIRLGSATQGVSLTIFRSYSIRVKHIVHRHRVLVESSSVPMYLSRQLPNLESARIESRAIGEVALRMSLTLRLRVLTLQTGYAISNPMMTLHSIISLFQGCLSLEQLFVRGYSPRCLHAPLSGITTLRSLSLHLSSLTERSFMTVSTFPFLAYFDVHADCLSYDMLSTTVACTRDRPFFPALGRLKIRSQLAFIALVVQHLPRNKLCSLHIDTTGPVSSSAFDSLFRNMATLPLCEFALEYTIDESQDILTHTLDDVFTLERFRPLSKLPLKRFILDSSLPLDLSGAAIEEMVNWWPLLDRLELDSRIVFGNTETSWNPRTSLASLSVLARGCKHLKTLVITLDVDSAHSFSESSLIPLVPHPLTSLSISSHSRPDVPLLSTILSKLFPSLRVVTSGSVGEYEQAWAAVQATILNGGS